MRIVLDLPDIKPAKSLTGICPSCRRAVVFHQNAQLTSIQIKGVPKPFMVSAWKPIKRFTCSMRGHIFYLSALKKRNPTWKKLI